MSAVRPAIKSAFFLACLTALGGSYFINTPLPLFQTRLKEIVLAAVILWSAGGFGTHFLQDHLSVEKGLTHTETLLFAEAVGLGGLSWLMIFLGAFHAWVPAGAWALLVLGILMSRPFLKNIRWMFSSLGAPWILTSESLWPCAALLLGGILSFLLALAPITYYDSLVYHFALPAAYIQAHHWVALPHLIYSSFPQTLEMLWTLALLVGDDTVANLIAWSISLLLLTAIITYAKRFFDLTVGLIAAALVALMPAFLLLSSGGYVDIGLTFFSFMSLYAAFLWSVRPASSMLILSGCFAGWAIGTKYTGVLSALLAVILLIVYMRRQARGQMLRGLLIYGGSALVICSPWLIKNMLYVGNPVFPFFYNSGVKELNPWVNQAAAGYFEGIMEYHSRSIFELPSVVWQAAVNGLSFGRGIDVLGDFGWVPLFGWLPALWLCRKLPDTVKLLLVLCAVYFALWGMSRPVLRFLLPISPLLALLVSYAWVHGVRMQTAAVRWLSRAFLGSFVLSGLFLFVYAASLLSSFGAAIGLEGRESYLARVLDYYAAATFVNTLTPLDSCVYVLGDQRGYYYQRKTWISPVFSKNPLIEWANTVATPQALRQRLQQEGITHLLVNRSEYERLKIYPYSTFSPQGQRNWDRMQSTLIRPLYHDRACDVYAL